MFSEMTQFSISGKIIEAKIGDITGEKVDAIVNAANEHLRHGGGVAGAIVSKGGKSIQEESKRAVPVPTGSAALTGAGSLPATYVIHAVGPIWGSGDEEHKLRSAFKSAIRIAEEKDLKTISFPAISAGIYGFPLEKCAKILISAACDHFTKDTECSLEKIVFCLFDKKTCDVFVRTLRIRLQQ